MMEEPSKTMNIKVRRRVWIPLFLLSVIGPVGLLVFKHDPVIRDFDPKAIESQVGRRIDWKGRGAGPTWGVEIFRDDKEVYVARPGPRELERLFSTPAGHDVRVKGVVQLIERHRPTPREKLALTFIRLGEWQVEDLGKPPPDPARSRPPLVIHVKAFHPERPWIVTYPDGRTSGELHLPRSRPIKLILTSGDGVIHTARGLWAHPNVKSESNYFSPELRSERWPCMEPCGPMHSQCGLNVVVQEEKDFETWLSGLSGQRNQE